jgi:hypothetical protein
MTFRKFILLITVVVGLLLAIGVIGLLTHAAQACNIHFPWKPPSRYQAA